MIRCEKVREGVRRCETRAEIWGDHTPEQLRIIWSVWVSGVLAAADACVLEEVEVEVAVAAASAARRTSRWIVGTAEYHVTTASPWPRHELPRMSACAAGAGFVRRSMRTCHVPPREGVFRRGKACAREV